MRDFSVQAYLNLLDALRGSKYEIQTFREFLREPKKRSVILRHDVDRRPLNSLEFAKLESEWGVQSSYYFRIVDVSFDSSVIKEISALGHEIGYHYEDMDLCAGDVDKANISFQKNLARLRKLDPVETICMHGSPLSKYDNRSLWDKYNYREFRIIGEPYLDLDFDQVFYISDTGRKWNNRDASLRDKVKSHFQIEIKNTRHLIQLIQEGELPDQIMINTHPQRWNDNLILWTRELVWQGAKNFIKGAITRKRARKKEMQ